MPESWFRIAGLVANDGLSVTVRATREGDQMLQAVAYVPKTGKHFSQNRDKHSSLRIGGRDQNGSYGSFASV
jgi:hypothetical protein